MNKHTEHSSYREKLIEHLFVGELVKLSWATDCQLEVGKPEVDNSGYDIIVEDNGVVRHVQLKSSYIGSKTSRQKVHSKLAEKPSGCVIWVQFDEDTLDLGPFYFFGGLPGKPLLSIEEAQIARHTKGDRSGYKAERPKIRIINKGSFERIDSVQELYGVLFGSFGSQ